MESIETWMIFFFLGFVAVFAFFIFSYWYVYHNLFKPKKDQTTDE